MRADAGVPGTPLSRAGAHAQRASWSPGSCFLAVGLGDSVAGHVKIAQYEQLARGRRRRRRRPTRRRSSRRRAKAQERHELARAKLAFYQLLLTAGQLLSALGFALLAVGVLRLRPRALQPRAELAALH